MKRLEDYLEQNAKLYPDKIAIECRGQSITYKDLWARVQKRAENKAKKKDKCIVMRASQSISFLIDYFAIHLAGKVAVPLEKDALEDSVWEISDIVANSEIPDDVADILYTTGTTGTQKGTMISNKAILADADNLIDSQKFSHDLNFIICGPLNHIGSLSKIWPVIVLGAKVTVLENIKNMEAFFQAVRESKEKVATFLVPASIRMLLMFGESEFVSLAPKFDFIETGAAPISTAEMKTLCKILPNARLYNTYASTETGIISTHDFNAGYCVAGCLGKPMKHSKLFVDEDGFIRCQGDTIMSGYVGDAQTTSVVLRGDTIYTNDKGVIDSEGRLQLTGREGDVINVGGYKINPIEVEDVAKAYPGVADCICIAGNHPVLGTALKLLITPMAGITINRKELGKHMMENLASHKVPQMLSFVPEIKRTYNGKLDRKYYKIDYQSK